MNDGDRRVRRTRTSLHQALIALALEKSYDSITVQDILDRANVGRSTFYAHFQSKDDLLMAGTDELRSELDEAVRRERTSAKPYETIIAFSRAMFEHASGYRDVYHALLHTQAWPQMQDRLHDVIDELIRRECKAVMGRRKKTKPDVDPELFVHYVSAAFSAVLIWWVDRRSPLTPAQIDGVFRSLVLPTLREVLA